MIYDPEGINREKLAWIMDLKNVRRGHMHNMLSVQDRAIRTIAIQAGDNPAVELKADCAFPSATQDEINVIDADKDQQSGDASRGRHREASSRSGPGCSSKLASCTVRRKPRSAGGVATSRLEMSQNSMRMNWSRAEVDERLHHIMIAIHNCF